LSLGVFQPFREQISLVGVWRPGPSISIDSSPGSSSSTLTFS
jgi:hypothetical protein